MGRFVLQKIKNVVGRDVFSLIRRKLTVVDVEMVYAAHGSDRWRRIRNEIKQKAIQDNNIPMLDWLFYRNVEFDFYDVCQASRTGNLQTIIWMSQHTDRYFEEAKNHVIHVAIDRGDVHVLDWIKSEKWHIESGNFFYAISCNQLTIIEWFVNNNVFNFSDQKECILESARFYKQIYEYLNRVI